MLETVDRSAGKIIEKRVTVIKFSRDKCIGKKFCRISVKGWSDLTNLAYLEEGRATNVGNMVSVREVRVEFNS